MAATSPFVSAAPGRESTPTDQRRRIIKNGGNISRDGSAVRGEGDDERPPANKKVKLSSVPAGENGYGPLPRENEANNARASTEAVFDSVFAGTTEKASQTIPDFLSDPKNLKAIRETISEQFDMEILLKHRELRLIEQEIAKTQICMEQLRRCTLIPFSSPESILDSPSTAIKLPDNGIPGYAPPPRGIVDGPYARHYRQWLLPDPRFDGWGPEGPPPPQQTSGKSLRSLGIVDPGPGLSMSGRPQRQSVMKVQQKGGMGVQACLYRKNDGTIVRLECLDCGRSNFSSAQGFINHCRIAHQREYSSHDAAATACGQDVDEAELALASPLLKIPSDGPARHTRQTQQTQQVTPQQTPYAPARAGVSAKSGPKIPAARPNAKTTKPTAQRKNVNRRSSAVMTTPRIPGIGNGSGRPPTPPQDTFNTPHLEGLLKRKRIDVNLEEMKKEFEGGRINWDEVNSETEASGSDCEKEMAVRKDKGGDILMFDVGDSDQFAKKGENEIPRPTTPINHMDTLSSAQRRLVSKISPVPPSMRKQDQHSNGLIKDKPDFCHAKGSHDVEMESYDGSISSDEEDSYRSDAESEGKIEKMVVNMENQIREGSKDSDSTNTDLGFESIRGPIQLQKNYLAAKQIQTVCHPSPEPTSKIPVRPLAISIESMVPRAISTASQTPVTSEKFPPSSSETLASAQAGLSKQVRFVMPSVKNSMRKIGNTGGVFENGMAKVKFGNAGTGVNGAKKGVFSGFPSNGNGGEIKKV